jgi:hypothetical protein
MQYNENITEALAVLGQLAPSSLSAAAHTVGPFNTKLFRRIVAIVNIGALGSSATVDVQFKAINSSSSYVAVTGTTITQITTGSTNLVLVELRAETLAAQNLGPNVELVITVGTAASQVSAVVLGTAGYYPSSDYNVVTPTQTLVA